MRSSLVRSSTAILLACSLLPSLTSAQQPVGEETRPRRAVEQPAKTSAPNDVWNPPAPKTISLDKQNAGVNGTEPLIRVALATNVRSGNISTTGKLMNATGESSSFQELSATRVRVESRWLSPPPVASLDQFFIRVDGSATKDEAEQKSRELEELIGDDAKIVKDDVSNTWSVIVPTRSSREEATQLVDKLSEAGFDASLLSTAKPTEQSSKSETNKGPTSKSNLRLAARPSVPLRAVVGIAVGAPELFNSSAPVLFASNDETNPVRFNDRPYRGKIEVFANTRGSLTIVNVLGIEDYVRGVVANELSPGSYPALDALKAQAIAARTYALRNRGQFMSQGYDLLPTTRSQVYRGLKSENPLSTRAVDETRGMVATYNGEPINALYTSTCGGRTENSENIFNSAAPYLRSRECAIEGQTVLTQFDIKTSRDIPDVREKNVSVARAVALLTLNNFPLTRTKVSDEWLDDEATVNEVRGWLARVSQITRQTAPAVTEEVNHPGQFATALTSAMFGDSSSEMLLNSADVEYFLAIRDANEIPTANRSDVAALVRDGHLSVFPDATLRPRAPLSRGRALQTIARMLESKNLLQLQKGTARPAVQGNLIIRGNKSKEVTMRVSATAFLFRQIGDALLPVRSMIMVGGEPVTFHVGATGEVDYLEMRPAPNGASAERMSPFTNWTTELSSGTVQARLGRAARGIGTLTDLRVVNRGSSNRAIDLEVIGTQGVAHVKNGRIRSALGLREQLFVIERRYDENGRVSSFVFTGRGWGHGVGMCQVGAYGLAKQGLNYEQILKAYYTGIEVTRLY